MLKNNYTYNIKIIIDKNIFETACHHQNKFLFFKFSYIFFYIYKLVILIN